MFKKVFSRGDEHVALNSRQEAVPSPRQQQQQEPQAETDLEDDEDFEDEQLPMPAQTAAHSRGPDPMVSNQVGMGIRAASDAAHMASSVLPSAASRSSLHAGEQHQQQQQQEQSVPPRAQQQILQQHKQATMQKQKQPLAVEELQHQLLLESKAREELEDMLVRYERQLKAEIAARQAAEAAVAEALGAAGAAGGQHHGAHGSSGLNIAHEQELLQQDRAALEQMRADFESQLHTARSELAKAQAAMSSNEAQVRSEAAAACSRMAAEYEARVALLANELERTRGELAARTHTMAAELSRWKRQAAAAAAAVLDVKDEVVQRKRELVSTQDKMDVLIDKLYAGKEASSSLSGSIAAAASYQQAIPSSLYGPSAGGYGLMHPPGQQLLPELSAQSVGAHSIAVTARRGRDVHANSSSGSRAQHTRQHHTTTAASVKSAGVATSRGHDRHSAAAASALPHGWGRQQQQSHVQLPIAMMQQQQQQPAGFIPPWAAGGLSGSSGFGHMANFPSLVPLQQWQPYPGSSSSGGQQAWSLAGTWPVQHQQHQQQQVVGPPAHAGRYGSPALPSIHARSPPHLAGQQKQQQVKSARASKAEGSYAAQHLGQHVAQPQPPKQQQQQRHQEPQQQQLPSRIPRPLASGVPRCALTENKGAGAASGSLKATSSSTSVGRGAASRKPQKPDRFAEAGKNLAMISAIASRW